MAIQTVSHVTLGVRVSSAKHKFPMNSQDKLYPLIIVSTWFSTKFCLRYSVVVLMRKVQYNPSVTTHFFGSTLYCSYIKHVSVVRGLHQVLHVLCVNNVMYVKLNTSVLVL
jgi:hypothetical protein